MSVQVFKTLIQNYDEGGMVHQLVKQHCAKGILTLTLLAKKKILIAKNAILFKNPKTLRSFECQGTI